MSSDVILGAYGITFQWNRLSQEQERKSVLDEISFELTSGEFVALLGPNGSGKSTLLKLVAGVFSLNRKGCSGQVRFRGQDFLSLPSYQRAQRVVYLGSDLNAEFPLTAQEAVALGRTCQNRGWVGSASKEDQTAVKWAMERCLCWNLRDRSLSSLSGGERQLVGLARGLAQGAKVILLDESLSGMDLNHQARTGKMLQELAKAGWAICLVSHDINLAAEWADRVLLLRAGKKVADGPIRKVLTTEGIRGLYPDCSLMVGTNPVTGAPKVFFG